MTWLLFLGFLGVTVVTAGLGEALAGLAGAMAIDIPVTLLAGGTFAEMWTGWGLVDDAIMLIIRVGLGTTDKFFISLAVANATHMVEEAYEHYSHTDEQNKRYAQYLERHNPGQIYLWGNVEPRDLFELGSSLGVLAYRGTLQTVFEVSKDRLMNFVDTTAEIMAEGGGL